MPVCDLLVTILLAGLESQYTFNCTDFPPGLGVLMGTSNTRMISTFNRTKKG